MKKIIIGGIAVLTIAAAVAFNVNLCRQDNSHSLLSLANIEALAQESSENKYSYTYWYNSPCTVYVGGAYATGKKVTCTTGSDHPVCADCSL